MLFLTKDAGFLSPRDGGSLRAAAVFAQLRAHFDHVDYITVRDGGAGSGSGQFAVAWWRTTFAYVMTVLRAVRLGSIYHLRHIHWHTVREVVSRVRSGSYDGSVVEWSYLAPFVPLLPAPTVVDFHNIESELSANFSESEGGRSRSAIGRFVQQWSIRMLRAEEARVGRKATAVTVVSRRDRDVLASLVGERSKARILVAPNGVSEECFKYDGPRTNTAVFVGFLGWGPNADAARWLVDEVWPLVLRSDPTAMLQLIGKDPGADIRQRASGTVQVIANPESVIPYVGAARVATAPLLAAGGTRLKILEALACGTPVVATPMGALGLEELAGEWLDVRVTAHDFAAALLARLSSTPEARQAPRALVQTYRWAETLRPLMAELGA